MLLTGDDRFIERAARAIGSPRVLVLNPVGRLYTLFLAMPISWKETLQQYVGRLHRLHDNKRFVQVYDYVDNYVPMLARMFERRLKGYDAIGYAIGQDTFPPAAAHS